MTSAILYAPPEYVNARPALRDLLANGCGASGWKVDLVPDTIWGLSIKESCKIHDWMYAAGSTLADKEEADRVFLNNMLRTIEADTTWYGRLLKPLRRRRALLYYEAVVCFGGPAFWQEKNKEEFKLTVLKGVAP